MQAAPPSVDFQDAGKGRKDVPFTRSGKLATPWHMISKMATAEFLKGLPSYNETNFTKFHSDNSSKTTVKRPSVYLSTTDHPSEQIITTEKTNILLRYLHLQFDKKNSLKKRDANRASMETSEESLIRKRARMETTGQESP